MPARTLLIWGALAAAVLLPLAVAATSPLLEWRGPVYIAAGFAGVLGLGLLLVQPLLAAGFLPGLTVRRARRIQTETRASYTGRAQADHPPRDRARRHPACARGPRAGL